MEFFSGYDSTRDLVRLDPRTKLALFLTGTFIAMRCDNMIAMTAYVGFLCALLFLSGKRVFAAKAFALFALVAYVRLELMGGTLTAGAMAIVPILMSILMLAVFIFPMAIAFYLVTSTTRISQFLAAFGRMHLPCGVIVTIAVFFRFLPTVQEEWSGVRKAMAFRGISLKPAAVIAHPLRTVEYAIIPLLMSSVSVMDELTAAALARGLDSERGRTYYEEVRLTWRDAVVLGIVACMLVYVVAMGASL